MLGGSITGDLRGRGWGGASPTVVAGCLAVRPGGEGAVGLGGAGHPAAYAHGGG